MACCPTLTEFDGDRLRSTQLVDLSDTTDLAPGADSTHEARLIARSVM